MRGAETGRRGAVLTVTSGNGRGAVPTRGSRSLLRYVGRTSRSKMDTALFELGQSRNEAALGVENHRCAVENELVLASYGVHVHKGARSVGRPGRQHALALTEAVGRNRGRR